MLPNPKKLKKTELKKTPSQLSWPNYQNVYNKVKYIFMTSCLQDVKLLCEVVELYDSADVKTEVEGITCLIPVSEPHSFFFKLLVHVVRLLTLGYSRQLLRDEKQKLAAGLNNEWQWEFIFWWNWKSLIYKRSWYCSWKEGSSLPAQFCVCLCYLTGVKCFRRLTEISILCLGDITHN